MPRKKGENYWTEKHEHLVQQWIAASTEKEFTRIYNELLPALNYMVVQIMQRYFSVPQSRYKEVQVDTVNYILLRLREYYDKDLKKSYSYCGTIAKNYLYEQMVRIPNTIRSVNLEYTDEDYVLDNSNGIQYDIATEYDFKAIYEYFESLIDTYNKRMISLDKRNKNGLDLKGTKKQIYFSVRKKYTDTIIALKLCIEYIKKYENINMVNMLEYVFLNSDLKRVRVVNMFSKLFGYSVTIPRDGYITKDEEKDFNMFNDDWTPADIVIHKRQAKKRNSKKYDYITYF